VSLRLLANENIPLDIVTALVTAGHDVAWVRRDSPGVTDEQVYARARDEARLVLTMDKDFGELVFATVLPMPPGVILLRFSLSSPVRIAELTVSALGERREWEGHFTVVEETRLRMVPLPSRPS